jgi:hypothetical protein
MAEQALSYSASICEVAEVAVTLTSPRVCVRLRARGSANFANFRGIDE